MLRALIGCLIAVLMPSFAYSDACSGITTTVIRVNGYSPGPVSFEIIDPYPVTAIFNAPVLTSSTAQGIVVDQDVIDMGPTTPSCNDASVTVPSVGDYLVVTWRYHIIGESGGSMTQTITRQLTFCSQAGDAPPVCPPPMPADVPLFGSTAVLFVCGILAVAGAVALRR